MHGTQLGHSSQVTTEPNFCLRHFFLKKMKEELQILSTSSIGHKQQWVTSAMDTAENVKVTRMEDESASHVSL